MIEIIERATIETLPIELNYQENKERTEAEKAAGKTPHKKTDEDVRFNEEQVGKYPMVYINGVIVEASQIKLLKLYNNAILPELEMNFTDPTSGLLDDQYPLDNSIVSIFKKATSETYMGIKMDFKITDFTTEKGDKNDITFKIKAILNVDDLYLMPFESWSGTSFQVLKDMSKSMKLGFATNIIDTEDEMTWVNPANYKINFMEDIVAHSYLSDETFLFGYIDFYYNYNYVDIEKQLQDDISQQMNIGDEESVRDGDPIEMPLILTNNTDASETNMYISKYTVENRSTAINLEYGYRHEADYYDKIEDKMNYYLLDSISTEGDDDKIVLKDQPTTATTQTLYNEQINRTWLGKMDTDNVHENYLHAELQNKNNLKFLQKLKMVVRLSKPNFGLYRFQKVLVELYNMGKMETDPATTPTAPGNSTEYDNKIINKLSGEWLITSINYTFSKNQEGEKDAQVGNSQEITLVKRELTKVYDFPRRDKDKTHSKNERNSKSVTT